MKTTAVKTKAVKTTAVKTKALVVSGLLQKNLPVKTVVNINGIKSAMLDIYQAMAIKAALNEFSGASPKHIKLVGIKGNYTGKKYHRPITLGVSLDVWEWLDANPTASRIEAKRSMGLGHVNPITIGVQYKHWKDDQ